MRKAAAPISNFQLRTANCAKRGQFRIAAEPACVAVPLFALVKSPPGTTSPDHRRSAFPSAEDRPRCRLRCTVVLPPSDEPRSTRERIRRAGRSRHAASVPRAASQRVWLRLSSFETAAQQRITKHTVGKACFAPPPVSLNLGRFPHHCRDAAKNYEAHRAKGLLRIISGEARTFRSRSAVP